MTHAGRGTHTLKRWDSSPKLGPPGDTLGTHIPHHMSLILQDMSHWESPIGTGTSVGPDTSHYRSLRGLLEGPIACSAKSLISLGIVK